MSRQWTSLSALLLTLSLMGCGNSGLRPQPGISSALQRSADSRRWPSMGNRWLASIASRNGRERVELVDLRNGQPVPLPGINQADAQPINPSCRGSEPRHLSALVRACALSANL